MAASNVSGVAFGRDVVDGDLSGRQAGGFLAREGPDPVGGTALIGATGGDPTGACVDAERRAPEVDH